MSDKPRIFIAVPILGTIHPSAYVSHLSLSKPPGTAIATVTRAMPDEARNRLIEQALKMCYDYIFFLDDDMIPAPDLIIRLLNSMEADKSISMLAPFAYKRIPPFLPCVFSRRSDGKYDIVEARGKGIISVDAAHVAATLVRCSALRAIKPPWFEFSNRGEIRFSEDICFCEKLAASGGKIMVDADMEALHLSEPALAGKMAYEAYGNFLRAQKQAESRIVLPGQS